MHVDVVTAPASEPLTATEAKLHLRVDGSDENDLITALIVAARQYVEKHCGLALITQTLRLTVDGFADKIRLPMPPVTSITQIAYVDETGTTITVLLASNTLWRLGAGSMQSVVTPYFDTSWPATAPVPGAVQITYVAGYANAAAVPQAIKQAMLLLIGHWYKHREAAGEAMQEPPFAVGALLSPYAVPFV